MNTHDEYRRHGYHAPVPTRPPRGTETAASELARHRDPSLPSGAGQPMRPGKRVAWVRPTELTTYLAPLVGRGIDLHTELTRRARSGPATATRALQGQGSGSPSLVPQLNRTEGPSL